VGPPSAARVRSVAGVGSLVVHRSARGDVTLAFLAAWAAILFGRAAWLGQAWAAPLHQFENGSLALFAFHMISDPKTTPDSRAGRIVFASLVAAGTGVVQFVLFRTNGLMWSLAACSLFVPLLDRWLPGRGFEWSAPGGPPERARRTTRGEPSCAVGCPHPCWRCWRCAHCLKRRGRSVASMSRAARRSCSTTARRWRSSATATAPS
jgi:hypothetical protein